MAKKTSTNAVKKIDEQIKSLESNTKSTSKATSTKKSSTSKTNTTKKPSNKTSREKIVVAPAKKKTTTTKKKTTTKNVRDKVIVTPKKTTKKSTTKTITQEKIKDNLKDVPVKKEPLEVVSSREAKKKELASEVNKILEINDTYELTETVTPKFIQEEKPVVEKREEKKIKDFFADEEPVSKKPFEEMSLDDVDVIKFEKKETPKKKGNLKKKISEKEYDELKLDKPIDLDQIDKIEEFKIVEDFEKDVSKKDKKSKQQDFTRKRKGKGYVVDIKKKPTYRDLEHDLRDLYGKVNDVVDDFDGTSSVDDSESIKKPTKKKFHFPIFKKKEKKKVVPEEKKVVKKTKVVKDTVIADTEPKDKPSILDHISQRVLNFFLAVLFTIFFLMVIAFIAFVIYVSTF
mgnify:CR=1 FL=1